MTITLFVCPYGHESEAKLVEGFYPRYGLDYVASTWGLECQICGRTFVSEVHSYQQYGGLDYQLVEYFHQQHIYELDGPWVGTELILKAVEDEP